MTNKYRVTLNGKTIIAGDDQLSSLVISLHEEKFWDKPKFEVWGATDWSDDVVNQKSWIRNYDVEKNDEITITCLVDDSVSNPIEDFKIGPYEEQCNFCKKGKSEVEALIEKNRVSICNECVEACVEIIKQNRNKNA